LLPQLLLTASLTAAYAAADAVLLLLLLLRLWFSRRSGPVAVNPTLLRVCASANCISCAVHKFNEPLVGLDLHILHVNLLTLNAEVCLYFLQILKQSPAQFVS